MLVRPPGARHERPVGRFVRLSFAWATAVVFVAVLIAGTVTAAPKKPRTPRAPASKSSRTLAVRAKGMKRAVAVAPVTLGGEGWAAALPAVEVRNRNTNARTKIRLYADDGGIDREALRSFMRVAASTSASTGDVGPEVAEPLDPRLVQLVVRAAYHFDGAAVVIVSATRVGASGKHGTGDALDFQLEGVRAAKLASYLRSYPKAGVGVYTHRKTQYVHIDVRDRSYHWLDASPPGIRWRERRLADPKQERRDALYVRAMDLPEVASK